MTIYIQILLLALMPIGAFAQEQSPTDMQSQMNAADVPQSASTTTIYKTPLKTYQQYYAAFIGGHSKNLADCQTAAFNLEESDGRVLTEEDFAAIDAKMAGISYANFQLVSFVFTANAAKPKITFVYSCSRDQTTIKEQVELTMVDTPAGWKIDVVENVEK